MSKTNYVNPFRINALVSFLFRCDGDRGMFKTRNFKAAWQRESTCSWPNKSSLLRSTAQLGLSCVLGLVVATQPCWKVCVTAPLCSNIQPVWLSLNVLIRDGICV